MNTTNQTQADKGQKLVEAAVALLTSATDRRMSAVQLNKALFYLDLAMLRDKGHTFTDSTFVALEQGPVVAKYQKRLIARLGELGLARQTQEGMSKPIALVDNIGGQLDSVLQAQARPVAQWICKKTARQLSDFSHLNPGWKLAYHSGTGSSQPKPINMFIAMQQIVDSDPWLNQPLDAELEARIGSLASSDLLPVWK